MWLSHFNRITFQIKDHILRLCLDLILTVNLAMAVTKYYLHKHQYKLWIFDTKSYQIQACSVEFDFPLSETAVSRGKHMAKASYKVYKQQ